MKKWSRKWGNRNLQTGPRALAVIMTLVLLITVFPSDFAISKSNSTVKWRTIYPTSSSYTTYENPSFTKVGTSLSTGVWPDVYYPSMSGLLCGWYVRSWTGGSNRGYAVTDAARRDLEREMLEIWKTKDTSPVAMQRWANYAFPFTMNIKLKNATPTQSAGTTIYSKTVVPDGSNTSYLYGSTHQIKTEVPSSIFNWMNRSGISADNSGAAGNSMGNSYLDLTKENTQILLNTEAAGYSSDTSRIIRADRYSYVPTVNIIVDNPGISYITYHANDGTSKAKKSGGTLANGLDSAKVENNGSGNINFIRPHYKFDGWWTTPDNSGRKVSAGTYLNMYKDYDLYAHWKQSDFQVSYDANGAAAGYSQVPVDNGWYDPGDKFTVKSGSALKADHKVFTGWNTKDDGSGTPYQPGAQGILPSDQNLILYAQWENAQEYTVHFLPGTGSGTMPSEIYWDDGINNQVTLRQPDGISSSRGEFMYWELDNPEHTQKKAGEVFAVPVVQGRKDIYLTAKWGARLTYDAGAVLDVTGNPPADSRVYLLGTKAGVLNNTDGNPTLLRHKYRFRGWDLLAGDESDRSGKYLPGSQILLEDNETLYAHWSPSPQYSVEYYADPPSGVSGEDVAGSVPVDLNIYYNDGLSHKVLIEDDNGLTVKDYQFGGWADESGKIYQPGEYLFIDDKTPKNIRLHAKWYDLKKYKITYSANVSTGEVITGSAPQDNGLYYGNKANGTVTVLSRNGLLRPGFGFTGWNTEADGSGDAWQPGDTFHISKYNSDLVLFAQWKKALTITGLNTADKEYDGSAAWTGEVLFIGADERDDVKLLNTGGVYKDTKGGPDAQAGAGKQVQVGGLLLSGKNADKYCIDGAASNGNYIKDSSQYTWLAGAEIKKRNIVVEPFCTKNPIEQGDTVPDFDYRLKEGSLTELEDLKTDFDTPDYNCQWTRPGGGSEILVPGSEAKEASPDYELSMQGLSNVNYQIQYSITKLEVKEPEKQEVSVTYHPGKHGSGTPPEDNSTYIIYPAHPVMNSMVTVREQGGLNSSGCKFAGWSENPDAVKPDYVPGDPDTERFRITGDTDLYAVWQGDTPLIVTGLDGVHKIYDGTPDFTGEVEFTGAGTDEEVKVVYKSGSFEDQNVGADKTVTVSDFIISGADGYKYYISAGGIYDSSSGTAAVDTGQITKRPITIQTKLKPSVRRTGTAVPAFGFDNLTLANGTTLGEDDYLIEDYFGRPAFACVNDKGNAWTASSPEGEYTLSVQGLANPNYDITYEDSKVTLRSDAYEVKYNANLTPGEVLKQGAAPEDEASPYYQEDGHREATVLSGSQMEREGYRFQCWNTNADGSGTDYKPGETFLISDYNRDVTLYAKWLKKVTISGVDNPDKDYDATTEFKGKIICEGAISGDDVKILTTGGVYVSTGEEADEAAGKDKEILFGGIALGGDDADRYYLSETAVNGQYEKEDAKYTFTGEAEIIPAPLTIMPEAENTVFDVDDQEPEFSSVLKDSSFADGEDFTVLTGMPVYQLENASEESVKWEELEEPGNYYVTVSGYSNSNYKIQYDKLPIQVNNPDGRKNVRVTYDGNGADKGEVPEDTKLYYIYTIPELKPVETKTLAPGSMERTEYRFTGWNTEADGSGQSYAPGDSLTVEGNTTLYAQWHEDHPLYITGFADTSKIYDGNVQYKGKLLLSGLKAGDQADAVYKKAAYAAKDAGKQRITAEGIYLTGADADKYHLERNEFYNIEEKRASAEGEIIPRRLVLKTYTSKTRLSYDRKEEPGSYGLKPAPGYELVRGDRLSELGTPSYRCRNSKGESLKAGASPGIYTLTAAGLLHRNYSVEILPSEITVYTSGAGGSVPGDYSHTDTNGSSPDASSEKERKNSRNHNNSPGERQNSGADEKSGYMRLENPVYGKGGLVTFTDEEVPKAAAPFGAGRDKYTNGAGRWGSGVFGSIFRCLIHWIILLGIIITLIYDMARIRRGRKEDKEENLLFDRIVPYAPLILVLIFFFVRRCVLDLWLLLTWVFIIEIGHFFIRRAYKREEENIGVDGAERL